VYSLRVIGVALTSCLVVFVQPSLAAREARLEGHWPAVKIVHAKAAGKDQAADDKQALAWNSIDFLPKHKFEAMFGAPVSGHWRLRGSKVILIADSLNISTKTVSKEGSSWMTIKIRPIVLTLDQDGRGLERTMDDQTTVFRKQV
jgi:hypothetical protein